MKYRKRVSFMTSFEKLSTLRLVPVITLTDPTKAAPLASALCEGGLPCAEVTFRVPRAAEAIREMVSARPDMLVGAGTVLTPAQADEAKAAGASFIVAPGLNPDVVRYCQGIDIPIIPGVCTPSDIEAALALGLTAVKFFPAEAAGGVAMIKAMSAPYTSMRFMPTGGINEQNMGIYLAQKSVFACGGSWMVAAELLAANDFAAITRLTKQAVALIRSEK